MGGIGAHSSEERMSFMLEEKGLEGKREHDGAYEAVGAIKRARKVVDLLDEAFELIIDDHPSQPATKYVHAALFEAEHRAHILEERYRRTYR
jgi:predicted subunit of tRNA(5-methylaminomethyl-2-thiouridylate) methyltransferase